MIIGDIDDAARPRLMRRLTLVIVFFCRRRHACRYADIIDIAFTRCWRCFTIGIQRQRVATLPRYVDVDAID